MYLFYKLAFLFAVGSLIGWFAELFFRRFAPVKSVSNKWENPGFLTGPYLPIYGFGTVTGYLVGLVYDNYLVGLESWMKLVIVFVSMAFVITFLELIAGIIFVEHLQLVLWDYSDEFLNFKGIICPLYSLIWGILGILYYYLVHGYVCLVLSWFVSHLEISFVVGFFYGIFVLDCAYTFNLVAKIKAFSKDHSVKIYYEKFRETIADYRLRRNDKPNIFIRIISPDSDSDIRATLEIYREKMGERFTAGKDMVSEKITAGKDMVSGKFNAGKEAMSEKIAAGKDAVSGKLSVGKTIIADKMTGISSDEPIKENIKEDTKNNKESDQ